jgi:hypothetical protein
MQNLKIYSLKSRFLFAFTSILLLAGTQITLAQETNSPKPEENSQEAPSQNPSEANPSEEGTEPDNLRPLTQEDSLLSLEAGKKVMTQAKDAISTQQYEVAANKLQEARKIFNQLNQFYLKLYNSFSGIENRIAESQRKKALETGQMRDEATYQLALVHRAQNQPELAVPLLIQVIQSQGPTSELGKKSYQQLFELGFVDTPYATSE